MLSPLTDEQVIEAVVRDYFEGWIDGDAERMSRALHPDLCKRAFEPDGTINETSTEWMIEATGEGLGRRRSPEERHFEIEIEDMHRAIANVTVRDYVFREYLQLAKTTDGGWKIVNALWERA